MRYRWFCSRALFTGSGAIIALRCAEASSQREAICNTPHTQTRTA
ncbi:MAG: hypothetical protein ACRDN1_09700 [Trebonia sp.]